MNRIRAGYVMTRNPMNHSQIFKIPLSPDIVDCIVFWTKDPENMLTHLDELDRLGFQYYFQFTITPYGRDIEPSLRPKEEIIDTFINLSKRLGKVGVVWRYDPIILNDIFDISYHKKQFSRLCDILSGFTKTVTISFVDIYSKIKNNLIRSITEDEIAELSAFIGITAKKHGIHAVACCEKIDLSRYGIEPASCIDKRRIEAICGYNLNISKDKNQRPGCGCYESIDIGAYDTCLNGCIYCYANNSMGKAKRRFEMHNSKSEILVGEVYSGEKVFDKKVKSNKNTQLQLF